jgi:archaellum biogenesis protein FlaJ (TadC family)
MAKKSDRYDYITMLDEAQKFYETQVRSFDIWRDHAKTILGIASVLVSLFATFGTIHNSISNSGYYALVVVVIAILYLWLMIKSLVAATPGLIHHPIKPDKKIYEEVFLNKKEDDIVLQKLANYLNVIPQNAEVIEKRRRVGRFITIQLAVIVILMLLSTLIQLH